MDFENMNIWCWFVPALVGILTGIFGYLIGKSGSKTIDNSADLKLVNDKNAKLQADLDACHKKLSSSTDRPTKASVSPAAANSFDATAAKAALGKNIKQDDLKIVEGIGPKIAGLFHSFDIKTWKALSEVSVSKCKEVLNSGGEKYRMHDPSSWPMQGKMCYEGKWKELARWQEEHRWGKL